MLVAVACHYLQIAVRQIGASIGEAASDAANLKVSTRLRIDPDGDLGGVLWSSHSATKILAADLASCKFCSFRSFAIPSQYSMSDEKGLLTEAIPPLAV